MSIKKRIKPGKIEPSPDGTALLVHFTTEITHLDEEGAPGRVEKLPESREVPVGKALRGLRFEEIPALAQELVERCKYIPASKTKQVERVLAELLHGAQPGGDLPPDRPRRQGATDRASATNRSGGAGGGGSRSGERWAPAGSTNGSSSTVQAGWRPADVLPWATADGVDEYAEALYEEEMDAKAAGAQKLLRVCTEVDNLAGVAEHATLLGVLSRELRESAKRSHELAVGITGIFLCLAHFSQFHPEMARSQCGEATMRVVEYETRRRAVLHKELKLQQGQIVARGSAASGEERKKLELEERRYRGVFERQDRLLLLCLLMLRNLSEDPGVEKRLVSQRLCHFLLQMLSRNGEDLLIAALGFLHKLSIFEQNKDQLLQASEALPRLAELASHARADVALLALRVLHNLAFDRRGRAALVSQTEILAKLLTACQQAPVRRVAWKLLYQLTVDPPLRAHVASQSPGCIAAAVQMMAKSREQCLEQDTAALCINLAADEACAAVMVKTDGFAKAMLRGASGADPLALKVLRLAASHAAPLRRRLLAAVTASAGDDSWLRGLVRLAAASCERPEVLAEALGVLAALEGAAEVPWPELCDAGLMELLHRLLMPGFSDDDVLLECVILVGTLALDPPCAHLLATSKVPRLLPELLLEKQEDSDILVQVLFALRCLLLSEETREVMLQETEAPGQILDMLRDLASQAPRLRGQLHAVQAAAREALDLVLAVESQGNGEPRWTADIKAYLFEAHNAEWCQRIRRGERHQDHDGGKVPCLDRRGNNNNDNGALGWTDVGGLADRCWGGGEGGGRERMHRTSIGGGGFDGHKSTRHR